MTVEAAKKGIELSKQIDILEVNIKDIQMIEPERLKIEFGTSEGWIGVCVDDKETAEMFANLLLIKLAEKLKKTSKELEEL